MELSTSECRRFAQECRDLAKTAKTAEEIEFLREREATIASKPSHRSESTRRAP
jgi:hypothetical protein